jgi:superfamily II DNA or RNA helicase
MADLRCVVGGGWFLPPGSPHIDGIRAKYTCPNPQHGQAMSLRKKGKWIEVPDENVYACHMIPLRHKWGLGLMIPRGIALQNEVDVELHSVMSFPELEGAQGGLRLADGMSLRPYQQEAVDAVVDNYNGLIIAPCGAGKTMIGLGAMTKFDTRIVVLVHTNDLAQQWKQRIEAQLRTRSGDVPKVSICGDGKRDDSGQIVIAMFQSLAKGRWEEVQEWGKQFGVCIVDEAHHVPANTFSKVMMSMPAKVRVGLTATPDRPDGLGAMLGWHFGKELFRITTKELIDMGRVMRPDILFTKTSWTPAGKMDWPKLISSMCNDDERNDQILEMVESFIKEGRQVLVLSDRVQHCVDMADDLANRGCNAAALVGRMTKKQRAQVLADADSRQLEAIFATTIADEGLDLPGLDTIVLTTPTKALGRIQQRIGRIMRTAENKKKPIVVDLVDNSKAAWYAHKKRAEFYTGLGCNVQK